MQMIRLAALGCLSFAVGACTAMHDPNWKTYALAKDPLVHGPFLIGAERPSVGIACVRPGAVRSQDARGDWRPCPTEKLLPAPEQPVVTVEPLPPAGSYVIPDQPRYAPRSAASPVPRGGGRPRSAWDG